MTSPLAYLIDQDGYPVDGRNWRDIAEADPTLVGVTFDYAIPQDWADDVKRVTGTYPRGIVWAYPGHSIFGHPHPLTMWAECLIEQYNNNRDRS